MFDQLKLIQLNEFINEIDIYRLTCNDERTLISLSLHDEFQCFNVIKWGKMSKSGMFSSVSEQVSSRHKFYWFW